MGLNSQCDHQAVAIKSVANSRGKTHGMVLVVNILVFLITC